MVVFNERLAEVVEKYVKKGDKIYVEGQLQTRKWIDNGGQERLTTEVVLQNFRGEIVMLGSAAGQREPGDDRGDRDKRYGSGGAGGNRSPSRRTNAADLPDDDIPF